MEVIQQFLHSLHGEGLQHLIQTGGLVVLFAIVFAETGLLAGFFLPGDSLLFSAGAVVGAGVLKAPPGLPQDPWTAWLVLNVVLIVAAIAGDSVGYWFGRKTGPKLYSRKESRFFKREHLVKTQAFYEKHGGKTIILARWMPFARTFAPIVAGIAQMEYGQFMRYNVVGGISWVLICTTAGFLLGNIALVKANFEKVVIGIVLLSVLPAVFHVLKERAHKSAPAAPEEVTSPEAAG